MSDKDCQCQHCVDKRARECGTERAVTLAAVIALSFIITIGIGVALLTLPALLR